MKFSQFLGQFKRDRFIVMGIGFLLATLLIIRADFSHITPERQFEIERGRIVALMQVVL